jgi:hypothetical protein
MIRGLGTELQRYFLSTENYFVEIEEAFGLASLLSEGFQLFAGCSFTF